MKKTLLIAAIFSTILLSCKNEGTSKNEDENAVVKPITEAERLEGKLVNAENGEWFVIKDGERWRALSEAATTDYLKSVENGEDNVVKNVPMKTLEEFPIAGEVLPKAEFKSQTQAELLEGKVISAVNGEWYIIKDGKRWRPTSEQATDDYLKSIENGQQNVVKNVSVETLQQFPIAGDLMLKAEFKESK